MDEVSIILIQYLNPVSFLDQRYKVTFDTTGQFKPGDRFDLGFMEIYLKNGIQVLITL